MRPLPPEAGWAPPPAAATDAAGCAVRKGAGRAGRDGLDEAGSTGSTDACLDVAGVFVAAGIVAMRCRVDAAAAAAAIAPARIVRTSSARFGRRACVSGRTGAAS